MDKKTFTISVDSANIRTALKEDFLELEMYCMSNEYPNNNLSSFTEGSLEMALDTFRNKPILGYFSPRSNDFEEHNSNISYDSELNEYYYNYDITDGEKIIGLIRESDSVEIVELDGLKWIKVSSAIWCKYNRKQAKELLRSKNKKVSVEVSVVSSHMEDKIEVVDEFIFDGITILGKARGSNLDVDVGINGAHLSIKEAKSKSNFSAGLRSMAFAGVNTSELDYDKIISEIEEKLRSIYSNKEVVITNLNLDGKIAFYEVESSKNVFAVEVEVNNKSVHILPDTIYSISSENKSLYEKLFKASFINKDKFGRADSIEIDFSTDSISSKEWKDVSKRELRNKILEAKNYKQLVSNAYLVIENGWKDSPSTHLKYPIAEIVNDKLVINRNGIISASQMLSREKEKPYYIAALRKLNSIRKKAGMDILEKKESKKKEIVRMKKKDTDAKKDYKLLISSPKFSMFKKGEKLFVIEGSGEFAEDKLNEVKLSKEYEDGNMPDEKELAQDEIKCAEWTLEMANAIEEDDDEDDDEDEDDVKEGDEELKKLKESLDNSKKQLAEAEKEISELKSKSEKEAKEKMSALMKEAIDKEEQLTLKDKEDLALMVDEGKFEDEDACFKEIAFSLYKKKETFSYRLDKTKEDASAKKLTPIQKAVNSVKKKEK